MVHNKPDIDKTYVSDADQFLAQFDQTHPRSASQEKERQKHQRIAVLRDKVGTEKELRALWESF